MAVLARPLKVDGEEWGTTYTFERAGDVFAVHTHASEEENHITTVVFGSIRIIGDPKHDGFILEAKPGGATANWKPLEAHGFIALVDGTTIINLRKRRMVAQ